ncbi:sigma-54 dependent transcriptional regulator [Candidatus Aminicenantes bacterium AC-708-M15]|jgi:DNA-binding NtrC family response regulator|nr:sigma-54 dependent transcriptional regulator [SCandidatus Aminicenantes bacterium Aminicenantia_JdfR_composite]MCP2596798.1 sigma-54 dependent transcriptional regulator [Candidatus Aminicenantes bacterium AC-335-G13]MCP2598259.1 sigma-54 dependent transcriptional regulator [Candidatus Aminicenantes bacterium AC-335-L06]MCP2603998.1 sigma-54 dependent transcriptional regulator [Candidatus Aminicenantes bacterium AC-708-M15]MCP2618861.1 sigma-54 dependent transcriptional regulator [Candidatus 
MNKILIVDDEKSILDLLSMVFKKEGYNVYTALSSQRALELLDERDIDLVITDIKMPGMSGLSLLTHIKENYPDVPVIMITAYGSTREAVQALKAGALDYITKPFDIDELKIVVRNALHKRQLEQENIHLKKELTKRYSFENIVGKSKKMQEIFNLIERIAPTDATILIYGESGTGKELVAKAIHYKSLRRNNKFVSINCGALPENLLESELFGHVKGSFTGAYSDKRGLFEVANKGTLLLDEIGEMNPMTQVKLLRALQERKIRRVGGVEEIEIDVRIIASTNQNLKEKIKKGEFREDLFYRLNVINITLPPLRERKEDIPLLVEHFVEKYSKQFRKEKKEVTPEVMKVFQDYHWPGNIRELENVIERAMALSQGNKITIDDIPKEIIHPATVEMPVSIPEEGFNLNSHLEEISRRYIEHALIKAERNIKRAAEILGISYRSLRHYIDKYGIKK